MAKELLFDINTVMEISDNRNFLYIRTFKQNSSIFMAMSILAVVGGLFLAFGLRQFYPLGILRSIVTAFAIIWCIILVKIELRHRKRVKEEKTGMLGSKINMKFYEDHMVMTSNISRGESKLYYTDFYGLIETRSYYIFYYSRSQATMLKKKDIDEVERKEFHSFTMSKFEGMYRRL